MELHNDEVPVSTVYAVTVDGPYAQSVDWFITAEASNEAFRDAKADADESSFARKVARWQVHLPKRRMNAEDVALHVASVFIPEFNVQTVDDQGGIAVRLDVYNKREKEQL
jgi:hypothetical protein